MGSISPVIVNIADISPDDFFKVSKKSFPSTLTASLMQSGMLEIPYIIRAESGYRIFTCHNRIGILRESGITELGCYVLEKPDLKIFTDHASLKVYRNEIGPFGKIRALLIAKSVFKLPDAMIRDLCVKTLKLSADTAENEEFLNRVMNFPEILKSYLDEKDVSFRVIKDLSMLPSEWIEVLNRWLSSIQVRVNIFRMLTDYIFDIYRRGDSVSAVESVVCSDDKTLHDAVYKVRYPRYSAMKLKVEALIGELSAAGLTIDFPEYFDRGSATIKLDINKKSDCGEQLKKISKIDVEKLRMLLSLLQG